MTWTKTKKALVDLLTKEQTDTAMEMFHDYEISEDRFYRDLFHTLDDEFPNLELSALEGSKEQIAKDILEISKGRK